MDRQEMFDAVWNGMKSQGFVQSNDGDESCLYRSEGPDGTVRKCAAGHLIPDEDYRDTFEYHTAAGLKYFMDRYSREERYVLGQLQDVHDGSPVINEQDLVVAGLPGVMNDAMTPLILESRFRIYAAHYDLKVPE